MSGGHQDYIWWGRDRDALERQCFLSSVVPPRLSHVNPSPPGFCSRRLLQKSLHTEVFGSANPIPDRRQSRQVCEQGLISKVCCHLLMVVFLEF